MKHHPTNRKMPEASEDMFKAFRFSVKHGFYLPKALYDKRDPADYTYQPPRNHSFGARTAPWAIEIEPS